ncbi:Hypothetical protein CINCED_3A025058 [Cinara cedri]|uniref:Uncharacterized protein n=1 Tax=Cinara cedri TaxID=506608 RepID=A0A5E4MF06_9HEMI|nr:Hypothetical protein CINCED_3A025058 [Cinara cedri]
MEWNNEKVLDLIEMHEYQPVLRFPQDPKYYSDKFAKFDAREELAACKSVGDVAHDDGTREQNGECTTDGPANSRSRAVLGPKRTRRSFATRNNQASTDPSARL